MDVSGAGVIVTGGASGLGAGAARQLALKGAKVAIFDLDDDRGAACADAIGGKFFRVDVTDEEMVSHAIATAEEAHGVARVLVHCAGIAPPAKLVDRDGKASGLAHFTRLLSINTIGTFAVTGKFAERLHAADLPGEERGVIVNTASVAAFDGQIGQAAYAASKAAIVGMTLPLARELARYGIRVMTIAPGIFMTPMLEGLPAEAQASLGAQVPFPSRLGRPEEYAALVEAIIANPMLNGETIRLDGAIRMAPR